jgi:hypothetical protein
VELAAHPYQLLLEGKVNKVAAVLHGSNKDEGANFEPLGSNATRDELRAAWTAWYGQALGPSGVDQLGAAYNVSGADKWFMAAERSLTDQSFACGTALVLHRMDDMILLVLVVCVMITERPLVDRTFACGVVLAFLHAWCC